MFSLTIHTIVQLTITVLVRRSTRWHKPLFSIAAKASDSVRSDTGEKGAA